MKPTEFINKLASKSLWLNLVLFFATIVVLSLAVKIGLDFYTHHGETVTVPNVKHKQFSDAENILNAANLEIVVGDTGYVKSLPPDCILDQSIQPGSVVKTGRIIYVTVNASSTPTITLPDIIDNSSLREALAKLSAMGFKLGPPEFIPGERDWVYGVIVNGKHVVSGDKIAIDDVVIIQVGNGMRNPGDSIYYVDPVFEPSYHDDEGDDGEVDELDDTTDPVESIDNTFPDEDKMTQQKVESNEE